MAKEINGKALADVTDPKTQQVIKAGQQLPGFAWLRDDGTTSCGNWIYSGSLDRGREPAGPPRHRRSVRPGRLSELGMVVAGQSPRAIQPRVLRSGGQALGSDAQTGLVERKDPALGGRRRARLQARLAPEGPYGAVHHEPGRRRPHLRAAGQRSPTGPFPSTTSPSRARCRMRCIRRSRIIPWSRSCRRRRISTAPGRWIQHRLHDLPADRTLSLLDQEQSDERAADSRTVHRDSGGAGAMSWAFEAATR